MASFQPRSTRPGRACLVEQLRDHNDEDAATSLIAIARWSACEPIVTIFRNRSCLLRLVCRQQPAPKHLVRTLAPFLVEPIQQNARFFATSTRGGDGIHQA